jgi:hypothetical protein
MDNKIGHFDQKSLSIIVRRPAQVPLDLDIRKGNCFLTLSSVRNLTSSTKFGLKLIIKQSIDFSNSL